VGDETTLGPTLHYYHTDPYVMVFEDLKTKEFEMKNKLLDLEEAKMVYDMLAKLHAAVMVMDGYVSYELPKVDWPIFLFYFFKTDARAPIVIHSWHFCRIKPIPLRFLSLQFGRRGRNGQILGRIWPTCSRYDSTLSK
jgi:hypothetical protein